MRIETMISLNQNSLEYLYYVFGIFLFAINVFWFNLNLIYCKNINNYWCVLMGQFFYIEIQQFLRFHHGTYRHRSAPKGTLRYMQSITGLVPALSKTARIKLTYAGRHRHQIQARQFYSGPVHGFIYYFVTSLSGYIVVPPRLSHSRELPWEFFLIFLI